MKTIHFAMVLVLLAAVAYGGETKCFTVEHPEYNEAVCEGDGKGVANKTAPSTSAKPAATAAPTVVSEPVAEPAKPASTAAPAARAAKPGKETPAERLARRKALAIRNSQQNSGRSQK